MKAFLDYINEITNTEPFIITTHTFYGTTMSKIQALIKQRIQNFGYTDIHVFAHKELHLFTLSSTYNFTLSRNYTRIGKRFIGNKNSIFNHKEYKFLKKLRFI